MKLKAVNWAMRSAYCLNQDSQDYRHFLIDNYTLQNYQFILL